MAFESNTYSHHAVKRVLAIAIVYGQIVLRWNTNLGWESYSYSTAERLDYLQNTGLDRVLQTFRRNLLV